MKNFSLQKHLIGLCAALALAVSAVHAQAQNVTITFDLTQLQNNVASSTITGSDGVTTLTVSTLNDWGGNTGAINVDGTDGLLVIGDHNNALSFSFSKAVTLERHFLSSITYDTFGILTLVDSGTSTTTSIAYAGPLAPGSNDFSNKLYIEQGNLSLMTSKPSGGTTQVRWSSFTITAAVPEPASYALLLGFGAFLFIMIRHRIRR